MRKLIGFLLGLLLAAPAFAQAPTVIQNLQVPNSFKTPGVTSQQVVSVKDYGAILDGTSHPLSGYFASAAAAETVCPSLTKLVGPNSTTGTTNGTTALTAVPSAGMIGVVRGAAVTSSSGDIPAGTTVSTVQMTPGGLPTIVLSAAATGSHAGQTITFSYDWHNAQMDWCAFDGAVQYIRSTPDNSNVMQTNQGLFNKRLVVPNGTLYQDNLPLNLTCINDFSGGADGCANSAIHGNFFVDFYGSLWCNTGGASCIDGLGSTSLYIDGVRITSPNNDARTPSIGIQIGRTSSGGAAAHVIKNVETYGFFTLTPIYNYASEGTMLLNDRFENNDNNGGAWAGIFDGDAHFRPWSPYVKQNSTPEGGGQSFQQNQSLNTAFYPITGNSNGIFLSGSFSIRFYEDTYIVVQSATGACFTLYADGGGGQQQYAQNGLFDAHCEGKPINWMKFTNANPSSGYTLAAPRIIEGTAQAVTTWTSLFATDANTTNVHITNADINFNGDPGASTQPLFDTPSKYALTGIIGIENLVQWTYPATFNGRVCWNNGQSCYNYFNHMILTGSYTVSTLPTCSSNGEVVYVTDASAPTLGGTLTGGGSVKVLALCYAGTWYAN